MVRVDKKTGNLIIEIERSNHMDVMNELHIRRQSLYDLILQHDTDQFQENVFYGAVLLLQDLDPTFEQWEQILKTDDK